MAHNLNIRADGRAALMLADKPGCHGLGTVVQGAQTWNEAMKLAGLDWTVDKYQLEYQGNPVAAYGIFRADTGDFLGAVGDR